MSRNQVNLHLVPGDEKEVEIHVTVEQEEDIAAYMFSSNQAHFAEVFIRWLRERVDQPVSDFDFNLAGTDPVNTRLKEELAKSGANVKLAG
ncbi:hypothetical protein FLL45_18620 [Aliikangiella marina]|uniref:Uncharacterized protein n=1 Tax=Aliikangiella marina TaxID=1712262 RepID=A0A545T4V0_9GAMM|nr:hypothetical protein [Aliikangiella marina]TQV72233.1 hypothetical protein FLL45_18620 [Aliikangiella marina]